MFPDWSVFSLLKYEERNGFLFVYFIVPLSITLIHFSYLRSIFCFIQTVYTL
jgi:hypothetical protein